MSKWAILCGFIRAADCFADVTSRNKSPERILRIVLTCPILLVIAFSIRKGDTAEKVLLVLIIKNLAESLHACCSVFNDVILVESFCCSLTGEIDGIWPPSRHKEDTGLNDGVEFSTRSAQVKFAASGGKEGKPFFSVGGKTIFLIFVSILAKKRFASSSIAAPTRPRIPFPHFSNVPSGTAGGFFKARRRGNPP
ncbi:hypothetical protein TNCT_270581 [Trichonephila clavata]|uniref:Uncharacterized protein n=1 Tax=Trichonephila clavata TaxID=2740835 RepID=A0A8X6GCU6_TRICU|nr:hypothetical protein TNCT_270581 [Trichonephila clavata]